MELTHVFGSVRRHLIAFVSICFFGLLAGAIWAGNQPSTYEATSRIVIGPAENIEDANDRIQVGQVLNHPVMAANLSELLTSDRVVGQALTVARLRQASIEDDEIEAVVAPESNVVQLEVKSLDRERPVALIAPLTESGVVLFEDIYNVYRAEVIDLDTVAEEREPPTAFFGGIVGLIGGAMVGALTCLFIEALRSPRVLDDEAAAARQEMEAGTGEETGVLPPARTAAAEPRPAIDDKRRERSQSRHRRWSGADPNSPELEPSYPTISEPDPEPIPAWPHEEDRMTDLELEILLAGGAAGVSRDSRVSRPASQAVDKPPVS